jgi:hypothetical protein
MRFNNLPSKKDDISRAIAELVDSPGSGHGDDAF